MSLILQRLNTGDVALTVLMLVAFVLAIYLAIVPHEIAHGLVAKWNGDLTAERNGRLTMNPIVHFDPIGFLMLFLCGFGYAKPVPVNPYNFKVPRRGLFTVAIAGVTYNLGATIVGHFLSVLLLFFVKIEVINIADAPLAVFYIFFFFLTFFSIFSSVNLYLFLFNILPLGPLDGFKIVEAFPERDNKFVAFLRNYGTYILIALFVLSVAVDYVSDYVYYPWLRYVDVLGLYLNTFSGWISGGLNFIFIAIFGL